MKRFLDQQAASSPAADGDKKRRLRRGRRKSKAERLARTLAPSSSSNSSNSQQEEPTLALIQALVEAPGGGSDAWDRAQNAARRLGTREARALLVGALLGAREAPKAAAHYANRLGMREGEALEVLKAQQERPVAAARFLVDVNESVVSTSARVELLWTWIEMQSKLKSGKEDAEKKIVEDERKKARAELRRAARLLLHPLPVDKQVELKPSQSEKVRRTQELHRLLVSECLDRGRFLFMAPVYAASGFRGVNVTSHECSSEHLQVGTAPEGAVEIRQRLVRRIEDTLRTLWPDCHVVVFGSSSTGLLLSPHTSARKTEFDNAEATSKSQEDDLDMCVVLPSAPQTRRESAPLVVEAKEHLALYLPELADAIAIEGARIPIVQAVDTTHNIKCELSVNNVTAIWNSRLVQWLLTHGVEAAAAGLSSSAIKERKNTIRSFCLWLKHWRRVKRQSAGVSLSSYGLLLLALYFLQQQGLLPIVDCSKAAAASEQSLESFSVESVDQFFASVDCLPAKATGNAFNNGQLCWWSLVARFFQFYTTEFNYEDTVVSLRHSTVVTKASKKWTRVAWKTVLSIEDPVEVSRDLGTLFTRKSFGKLRCAFAHATSVFFALSGASMTGQEAEILASHAFDIPQSTGEDNHDDSAMDEDDNDEELLGDD